MQVGHPSPADGPAMTSWERPGLFVTGTDTGVGKTWITAQIARALRDRGLEVGVLKPLATGATRRGEDWEWEDATRLGEAVGGGVSLEHVAPVRFVAPLAPSVAARRDGTPLRAPALASAIARALAFWHERGAQVLLVEGTGGWLCPIAERLTVADLAEALDLPVLIVARRGLGTLNHTLLTVESVRRRGLRIAGVILNGAEPPTNPEAEATNAAELARHLDGIAILADIPHHARAAHLHADIEFLEWQSWTKPPRAREGLAALGATG